MSADRYEGLDSFVHARAQALTRCAYLLVFDAELAQDLMQQGLTAVAERWPKLREGNPEGYARKVILNGAATRWRRRMIIQETVVATLPDIPAPYDATAELDQRMVITSALRQLPPRQRAALVLRFYEDLTEEQTADLLGCSVGTVKSQTHRALANLRALVPTLLGADDEGLAVTDLKEGSS